CSSDLLTRVPRAAAVDEAVSLARAKRGRGAAAFTNAVLRTACRLIDQGLGADSPLPDEAADPALHLAEKHSFQRVLHRRLARGFGMVEIVQFHLILTSINLSTSVLGS